MTFAPKIAPFPRPDVEAWCLDCDWGTAAFLHIQGYDKFLRAVGWHEAMTGHIVHIYDDQDRGGG